MPDTIWAVDGSFFAQRLSGIQRYSIELLAALDRIVPPGFVEIVTPPGVETPHYTNIQVGPFGTHRGGVWQQLDYPRYLRQRGAGGLATCNVIPLFGFRGIAVVHDVCYRARPDFYTDPRGRLSAAWHCLQYRRIAKKAERLITVSEFSKSEIHKYYGVPLEKMNIVYNAWQQMQRLTPDDGIFAKHPQLQRGAYYFSMANLLKNKNVPTAKNREGKMMNLKLFGATPCDPAQVAPLLGTVRAGLPLYAEENIEAYFPIRQTDGAKYFWLTIRGDSMNAAGMDEGDQILVREQPEVENGEIAVVLVNGDEATVKTFRQEGPLVILTPRSTNPVHQPQIYDLKTTPVRVLGKVIECRKVF